MLLSLAVGEGGEGVAPSDMHPTVPAVCTPHSAGTPLMYLPLPLPLSVRHADRRWCRPEEERARARAAVEGKMPRRVKRKRPIVLDDGSQPGGMEEYYDYIFPVSVCVCVGWCVCRVCVCRVCRVCACAVLCRPPLLSWHTQGGVMGTGHAAQPRTHRPARTPSSSL